MIRHAVRGLLIIAGALLMSGCLVEKHTLVIKDDGSADLTVHYGMTRPIVRQLRNAEDIIRELPQDEQKDREPFINPYRFNKPYLEKALAPYAAKGVTVKSVSTEEKSGWHYATIVLQLRSVADLDALSDSELMANHRYSLKTHEGDYLITHRFTHNEQAGTVDLNDPEARESLLALLQGLNVTVDIQVPAYIRESNAHVKNVRGGTWKYDFDKNPESANRIQKDKRQLLFAGDKLSLPEFSMAQPAAPQSPAESK